MNKKVTSARFLFSFINIPKIRDLLAVDLRALALFRIALGLLILAQLVDRAFVLETFYTDQGLFPRILAMSLVGSWDWSLYFIAGSTQLVVFLFLIHACAATSLLIGYRTRLATFLCYLFVVSLETRNIVIPNGGDYLLRLLVFWSLFLPLGSRFSMDRKLKAPVQEPPLQIISMATAAFLLQVAFVYFFTALTKLGSEVWLNGEAIYDALALENYARPMATVIRHAIPYAFLELATYAVIAVELIGPVLLFSPFFTAALRLIAVFLLAVFQLCLGLCLEVNLFPWVAITATLPFLPRSFLDLVWQWGVKKKKHAARPDFLKASLATNLITGFFLIYITLSNVEGLNYKSPFYQSKLPPTLIPSGVRWLGDLLSLDQYWDMFIPPGKVIFWFVGHGKLKDGSAVDVLRDGSPVEWGKKEPFFKNEPWRAYLINLGGQFKDAMVPYVGPSFCREWNRSHPPEKQLQELEVIMMSQEQEKLLFSYKPTLYHLSLLKHACQEAS